MAHRGADDVHFHPCVGVEVIVVVGLQRRFDLLAARVEGGLVGLFGQADEHFAIRRIAEGLNARIFHARRVNGAANGVDVGSLGKLHFHLRAAAKIHAQRNRAADVRHVPAHLHDAGHAEDHGKGEEVPFPSQPVHIYAAKKFHCFFFPSSF